MNPNPSFGGARRRVWRRWWGPGHRVWWGGSGRRGWRSGAGSGHRVRPESPTRWSAGGRHRVAGPGHRVGLGSLPRRDAGWLLGGARVAGVRRARGAGGLRWRGSGVGFAGRVGVGVGVVPEVVAGAGPADGWGRTGGVAFYAKVVVGALVCRVESDCGYRSLASRWDWGPGWRVLSNKSGNKMAPVRESDLLVLVVGMGNVYRPGPQVVCCGRGVGA